MSARLKPSRRCVLNRPTPTGTSPETNGLRPSSHFQIANGPTRRSFAKREENLQTSAQMLRFSRGMSDADDRNYQGAGRLYKMLIPSFSVLAVASILAVA